MSIYYDLLQAINPLREVEDIERGYNDMGLGNDLISLKQMYTKVSE